MIGYKVLTSDGRSTGGQSYQFNLPSGSEPGDWMDCGMDVRLHERGFHAWDKFETAMSKRGVGQYVYEMEIDEDQSHTSGSQKVVGRRVRLLSLVADENGELVLLSEFVWQ